MKTTVIICTWNRAALLEQTLAAIAAAQPPETPWEVLVVNNRCTDRTDEIVDNFRGRLPLRPCHEEKAGLSNARNAGMREARGEYILWTDDDVLVDPDWLRAYERAFATFPDATLFGGPVRAWFDGDPPKWLAQNIDRLWMAYALRDLGPARVPLAFPGALPFGANFAVRAEVQRRFPFDPELGRKGSGGALGEETAVMAGILAEGAPAWWLPEARVRHFIPRERQTLAYLKHYFLLSGKTEAMTTTLTGPRLFGSPRWVWKTAALSSIAYIWARFTRRPPEWIPPLRQAYRHIGMLQLDRIGRRGGSSKILGK